MSRSDQLHGLPWLDLLMFLDQRNREEAAAAEARAEAERQRAAAAAAQAAADAQSARERSEREAAERSAALSAYADYVRQETARLGAIDLSREARSALFFGGPSVLNLQGLNLTALGQLADIAGPAFGMPPGLGSVGAAVLQSTQQQRPGVPQRPMQTQTLRPALPVSRPGGGNLGQTQPGSEMSTEKKLMIGGGIVAGGALIYVLTRKKGGR